MLYLQGAEEQSLFIVSSCDCPEKHELSFPTTFGSDELELLIPK